MEETVATPAPGTAGPVSVRARRNSRRLRRGCARLTHGSARKASRWAETSSWTHATKGCGLVIPDQERAGAPQIPRATHEKMLKAQLQRSAWDLKSRVRSPV